MTGPPSPAAFRRAFVASVAGAGIALVGLSFANVASLDATLSAATQRATPPVSHDSDVSFDALPVRDCPRERPQHPPRSSTHVPGSHLQY